MEENINQRIDELTERIQSLSDKYYDSLLEINKIKSEIKALKIQLAGELKTTVSDQQERVTQPAAERKEPIQSAETIRPEQAEKPVINQPRTNQPRTNQPVPPVKKPTFGLSSDLERFIGENLVSKIGIAITILGIAVGTKYAIDKELISPLMRIVLGYLAGSGLLLFGLKLKEKYASFSSVLLSGAMASYYFITYFAYILYGLFPQLIAFFLMVVFTVFTVLSAISYNKQLIAHIGLVGAYAVPFLLSNHSGQIFILFTYLLLINAGILYLSFIKKWQQLYLTTFIFTWIITGSALFSSFDTALEHTFLTILFLIAFYLLFYALFIFRKIYQKEPFEKRDIANVVSNSLIFYSLGMSVLSYGHDQWQGTFTLLNAIMQFGVSYLLHKKSADKNIFHLAVAMTLVFVAITIPVQFSGYTIAITWGGIALALFWTGIRGKQLLYWQLSLPLFILSFLNLIYNWNLPYHDHFQTTFTPVLNSHFGATLILILFYGTATWFLMKSNPDELLKGTTRFVSVLPYFIPGLFLVTFYFSFYNEINLYWEHFRYHSSLKFRSPERNQYWNSFVQNINRKKLIWLLDYSLVFWGLISLINLIKLKNQVLNRATLIIQLLILAVSLLMGMYALNGINQLGFRYLTIGLISGLLVSIGKSVKQADAPKEWAILYDLLVHLTALWLVSSELVFRMDIEGVKNLYKLGLSILWGVYALLMVIMGIAQEKKHVRFGAFALFGTTLIKLFFYDISHLNSISKTIVFFSLGVLLLIISFLYNKNKNRISGDES